MKLTFLGCGDAFGSGGRMNTCFHVEGEAVNFLIDCGASSLIALKANKVALNALQAIFITHFHADHFGGIPFFVLDAQFFSKRKQPLALVGPPGLREWYERVLETAFPGASKTQQSFELTLHEIRARDKITVAGVEAQAFQMNHGNPGGPFFAYRLHAEGKSIAYTGDTEWTDEIVAAAYETDLFIAESYFFDKKVPLHLDLASLEEQLSRIKAKRLVLTHMSDDMLSRLAALTHETAYDGKVVHV